MQVAKVHYNDKHAPADFTKSLKETGFGVITGHPIPIDLVDRVYQEWKTFFSSTSKHDYLFDSNKQDGYFPIGTENAKGYQAKDHKEFYHFYPWGRIPDTVTGATLELYNNLVTMTSTVLEWIEIHTPKKFDRNFVSHLKI